jgi:hypothetical protein
MEATMDPFSVLTTGAGGLGLSPNLTASFFGIVADSIGLTIVNLMKGEPVKAIRFGVGGSAFLGVVWAFGRVSGARGVI